MVFFGGAKERTQRFAPETRFFLCSEEAILRADGVFCAAPSARAFVPYLVSNEIVRTDFNPIQGKVSCLKEAVGRWAQRVEQVEAHSQVAPRSRVHTRSGLCRDIRHAGGELTGEIRTDIKAHRGMKDHGVPPTIRFAANFIRITAAVARQRLSRDGVVDGSSR